MSRNQPKKYINKVRLKDKEYGLAIRKSYAKTILKDAPVFPKPLDYADIDRAVFDFVQTKLKMTVKNKLLPTYTLYSNQRFSEYSQTWQHTDEEGNLLMNFKTVNRESNPKPGDNQGGLWNIPGEQRYTLLIRDVLEDNGTESYEIYSMKQPYCVDLTYRVSIITDMFENLNEFNSLLNSHFKARQCYIRPNGHYIPMTLDDVTDNTEYTISDRKFYNQTATIKVMAYIIKEQDFSVEKKPKNIKLFMEGDTNRPKPTINIEEYFNDKVGNQTIDLYIDFEKYHSKIDFDIDTDFVIESIELVNIFDLRVAVNNRPFYVDDGFEVRNGDNLYITIKHIDPSKKSQIKFIGYNPSVTFDKDELPLDVCDDVVKHEDIVVI